MNIYLNKPKEVLKLQKDFFRRFIEEEKYLENPPLETKKFIDFCKKRGIETSESELEFFEKEKLLYPLIRIDRPIGEEKRIKFKNKNGIFGKPARQGLSEGEEEISRYKVKYYSSYGFDEFHKDLLINWLEYGNLFDPSTNKFQDWSSFEGEELENGSQKIVSYYSSFQIYLLERLKKNYSFKFQFTNENWNNSEINNIEDFINELNNRKDNYRYFFDFKEKKDNLKKIRENFDIVLEFLLSIAYIYAPYGRSSSKTISISDEKWYEKREKFNPKKELEELGFTIQETVNLYWNFSKKVNEILGVKRDDWIQLWKSFAWNEKNELNGNIRLGIEYLQWALMIKRFIENYCGREILDIDEISNISPNDILKYKPPEMDQYGILLRASRNKRYFDPEKNKNYFYDKYKRLFYLANDFNIDYQPRIMVFVEGETEKRMFPKLFEWYYDYPENHGIEIVNFKGVDKLLSTSKNVQKLRNIIKSIEIAEKKALISKNQKNNLNKLIKELKKTDIIISNWTSFIRYNLEKWQIIPFFVADDEGNVRHFLEVEEPITFEGKNYNIPTEWKYLWGITNNNEPYKGNNFEFANFSDEEIALAVNHVLNDEIDINKIKNVRESGEGIKKIDDRLNRKKNKRGSKNKRKIVEVLFDNLFKKYEETGDKSLLERPIFKLIEKIAELGRFNHPPVDRNIELINKKYITDLLEGNL